MILYCETGSAVIAPGLPEQPNLIYTSYLRTELIAILKFFSCKSDKFNYSPLKGIHVCFQYVFLFIDFSQQNRFVVIAKARLQMLYLMETHRGGTRVVLTDKAWVRFFYFKVFPL